MKNPAIVHPDALPAIQALAAVLHKGPVPEKTLGLVHLRASQINGCGFCLDLHVRMAKKHDETVERMVAVAGWREVPYFTEAERAALALAEAVTRLPDRAAVPDDVWQAAARHFDEPALAQLVLYIGLVNFFNHINVTTQQIAGTGW